MTFHICSRALGDYGIEKIGEQVAGAMVEALYSGPVTGVTRIALYELHAPRSSRCCHSEMDLAGKQRFRGGRDQCPAGPDDATEVA